jgi:RNA polymerase sigma-70 factor (ECF subfamily)
MGSAQDDAALVAAARSGDRAALAALIERHRGMARALCWRMLGDDALADDALQEAALQAMLAIDRLRVPARFGSWLGGIALNVCRGMLAERRDVWSWETLSGGVYVAEPVDPAPEPAVLAEERDLAARVRRAVDSLPTGQRAAVLMVYLAGLSHAETAALLGTPAGAVKTRLHKARARLRRDLIDLWREETMTTSTASELIEMRVAEVQRKARNGDMPESYRVTLEEVGGARRLLIWIGRAEARALVCKLDGIEMPRPQTEVLAQRLLEAVGGRIVEVRITELTDEVFYAVAVVEGPTGRAEVDARPSDALNLALLAGAPIRAAVGAVAKATEGLSDYPGTVVGWSEGRAPIAEEIRAEMAKGAEMRAHMASIHQQAARHRAAGHVTWSPAEHEALLDDGARAALAAADGEARRHRHGYLGTEYLLLGLLGDPGSSAAQVMAELGVTLEAARAALDRQVAPGTEPVEAPIAQTPRLRLALGRALDAARETGSATIGPDHLLFGLTDVEGIAARMLTDLGVDLAVLRDRLVGRTSPA